MTIVQRPGSASMAASALVSHSAVVATMSSPPQIRRWSPIGSTAQRMKSDRVDLPGTAPSDLVAG
jgi:hypothetical protein